MVLMALVTFGFLLLLICVKILSVLELRSLSHKHHRNQNRSLELEADLDTSRRRYLIALKAEGVAKHKVSKLKMRFASAKQNLEQIEATAVRQETQHLREKEGKLEALVMQALGGSSVRRDSHFKKVMSVIRQLIDLEKHSNTEELMAAIQEKLAEMGKKGQQVSAAPTVTVLPATKATESTTDEEAVEPPAAANSQPQS